MKTKKGVSMISLIIVIIVLIILASITIYYGWNANLNTASDTKSVYVADTMLEAVMNRELMHQINPNYYEYVGDNTFGTRTVDGTTYRSEEGWYLLKSNREFSALGLDNLNEEEYLVHYSKGLVISVNGAVYQDVRYYSLNELKKASGGGTTILANAEYDSVKKVNKPVLITGMVPVKLNGNDWVVASPDDSAWYDYSSSQKAWANVMLKDELEVEGYSNEQVRKASISDLAGKKVTTEGSSYVWIPRYSQTTDASKIIFSELLQDKTGNVNGDNYQVPSAFRYGAIELPGIWISKYEVSF